MIRRFLLPAIALAMLGGCVTSGYEYRGGNGDYYYGQPQVEYRDYGYPYGGYGYGSPYGGFGYGYPGGWSGSFGLRYGYGDPYGFYGGYYDPWRYYYGPYRPPHHHHDHGQDQGNNDGPPRRRDDDRRPPWRDLVRVPPRGGAPLPQQRLGDDGQMLRAPVPRMGEPPMVMREERRAPERSQSRGESDRIQLRRERENDPSRTREP